MAKTRSPNYPSLSLAEAINAVTEIHKADKRNRVSREAVAEHLGYKSLSGPVLVKLGALRAYGLLEGGGDDLRVSQDAVVMIADEPSSEDRQRAIRAAASRPNLFQSLNDHFEGQRPSEASLRSYLIKHNFSAAATDKVIHAYLDTFELASREGGDYNAGLEREPGEPSDSPIMQPPAAQIETRTTPPQVAVERVICRYDFEPEGNVTLTSAGPVSTEEALDTIERLIEMKRDELKRKRADSQTEEEGGG
jgi:hypothetical protein